MKKWIPIIEIEGGLFDKNGVVTKSHFTLAKEVYYWWLTRHFVSEYGLVLDLVYDQKNGSFCIRVKNDKALKKSKMTIEDFNRIGLECCLSELLGKVG